MPAAATAAGKIIAVTRWREDTTRDNWGTFCYIRDVTSGEFWSTAYQPTLKQPDRLRSDLLGRRAPSSAAATAIFDTHTEIAVSPEDDIELRRVTHHQPLADAQDHRGHQLRGSRSGLSRRRRLASGLQQSVCADRDRPRAPGDPLHPPAPLSSTSRLPGCFT